MTNGLALKTQPDIDAALRQREEWLRQRKRPLRLKMPAMLYPVGISRTYQATVRGYFDELAQLVNDRIIARLPELLRQGQFELGIRTDTAEDDLRTEIEGIEVRFGEVVPASAIGARAVDTATLVSGFNLKQNDKMIKQVLQVDPFRSEPWLRAQMQGFAKQNVTLIKSLEQTVLKDVETIVYRGWRQGLRDEEVSKEIRQKLKVSKSRADLIARDQINKLNGQLSRVRQQELGLLRYRWRTARDERVRATHAAREGRVFSWDSPPADGHPGEPINCRCYAEPILEDLI